MATPTIVDKPPRQPNSYEGSAPPPPRKQNMYVGTNIVRPSPPRERTIHTGFGSGRRKGSLNKLDFTATWRVDECFRVMGGDAAFAQWAKANQTEFYLAWIKARVPRAKVDEEGERAITIVIEARPVRTNETVRVPNEMVSVPKNRETNETVRVPNEMVRLPKDRETK